MLKKEGTDKKKSHDAVHKLKAFEAVFRAECQVRGCVPHKPLLRVLQEAAVVSASSSSNKSSAAAAGKKAAAAKGAAVCDVISLQGTDSGVVCAAVAGLAGYPACRALRLVDYRLGDTGLGAVAALLRGSVSPWWRGSKLTELEIWGTGSDTTEAAAAAPAPAVLQSASDAQPPAGVVGTDAAAAGVQGDAAAPVVAQGTEQPQQQQQQQLQPQQQSSQQQQAAEQAPTAASPGTTVATSARRPAVPRPATAPAVGRSPARSHGGRHLVSVPSFGLLRTSTTPKKLQRPGTAAAAAHSPSAGDDGGSALINGKRFDSQLVIAQSALRDRAPGREELPTSVARLRTPLEARSGCLHATLGSSSPPTTCAPTMQLPLSNQPCPAASSRQRLARTASFGPAALRDFSLALGASGLALSTLIIDGIPLGDAGIELLAPGLQRCSTLTALSLRGCGLGPAGAATLAAALAPPAPPAGFATVAVGGVGSAVAPAAAAILGHHSRFRPPTLAIASASGTAAAGGGNGSTNGTPGSTAVPITGPWRGPAELRALALSSNPLGAGGVLALGPLLRQAPALEELALADVGLTADDTVAVQALVSALIAGAPAIAALDLRLNYIGDRGASLLLPLLPARPTLSVLKITPHLGRPVVKQLLALVEVNAQAAAAGRRRRKSSKKAAATARR